MTTPCEFDVRSMWVQCEVRLALNVNSMSSIRVWCEFGVRSMWVLFDFNEISSSTRVHCEFKVNSLRVQCEFDLRSMGVQTRCPHPHNLHIARRVVLNVYLFLSYSNIYFVDIFLFLFYFLYRFFHLDEDLFLFSSELHLSFWSIFRFSYNLDVFFKKAI